MTDTATQLARYKKLAQQQAETIRRLREELTELRGRSWPEVLMAENATGVVLRAAYAGMPALDLPRNVHGLK